MVLVGPFQVETTDQALYLRLAVTGPALDVLVLPRGTGDLWRQALGAGAPLGPPPGPPIFSFSALPGGMVEQRLPLPAGQYFIVLDNSARLGTTNPPWTPLGAVGGNTALASYAVELGDATP